MEFCLDKIILLKYVLETFKINYAYVNKFWIGL